MKVKMKVWVSGSRNGRPWPALGEELTVPDHEGKDMCAAGLAEPVAEKPKVETREEKAEPEEKTEPENKPESREVKPEPRGKPDASGTKPAKS